MSETGCSKNTDREVWRKVPGDYYSPKIFVTEDGNGVGIDVGGFVRVLPVEFWHRLGIENDGLKKQIATLTSQLEALAGR